MEDSELIARGFEPKEWSHTFHHPDLGELTFTAARLPTARDYLTLARLQEEIAPGVTQGQGALLAEAIAGILTLIKRPVVKEERIEDPETPGRVQVLQQFYDPEADSRFEFPILVWGVFMGWRNRLLSEDTQEQVKNSSGATGTNSSGNDPVAPSPTGTESLPSTLASAI